MYDGWTSLLSDELLARAVRVDGILYLPAYGLAAEWFEMIFPYFFAFGVAIASGWFVVDLLYALVKWLALRLRKGKSQG